jgi:formamidopyrimidine-DNA glycosylase
VSIELPEAHILASQMNEVLNGKKIQSYDLQDIDRMIKIGFINKNILDFDDLVNKTIVGVESRGNTIHVELDMGLNILIGPEYGGRIHYHPKGDKIPKYHLRLDFTDGTKLSVRITSMGVIKVLRDENLDQSYLYKRDFLSGYLPSSKEFTFEQFYEKIHNENRQIKPLLVGKNAIVVGLSNSAYQDIIHRAGIHPKQKASKLTKNEIETLYNAIKTLIQERLKQGGKTQFKDLYGKPGKYTPLMGPNMKDQNCPKCETLIEKLAHGGGHVYICPSCQKL